MGEDATVQACLFYTWNIRSIIDIYKLMNDKDRNQVEGTTANSEPMDHSSIYNPHSLHSSSLINSLSYFIRFLLKEKSSIISSFPVLVRHL